MSAGEARRFVIRDELGEWVETHVCGSRERAIALFSYPALVWDAFAAAGWTCAEETPPREEPAGERGRDA